VGAHHGWMRRRANERASRPEVIGEQRVGVKGPVTLARGLHAGAPLTRMGAPSGCGRREINSFEAACSGGRSGNAMLSRPTGGAS